MVEKIKNPESLSDNVTNLYSELIKELNNDYIFIEGAIPLLKQQRKLFKISKATEKQAFSVPPAKGKKATAKRTPAQLQQFYDRFIERDIYGNFLIAGVSRLEVFLYDVLQQVLLSKPHKLNINAINDEKKVSLTLVLNSGNYDELLRKIIRERLEGLFHHPPKEYLRIFGQIAEISVADAVFLEYQEIKATRDLLVHNASKINKTYLEKAGKLSRGVEGDVVEVSSNYFTKSLSTLKRMAQIINDGIRAHKAKPANP